MPRSYQIPRLRNCADTREGPSAPYSIIHSPSFTFLVGPKHTKLTIQSGLARHVSKPLHNLMNNGHTRESKHRIAVLEDLHVETFVAFCEYAYTGDYNVPLSPATPEGCRTDVVESAANAGHSWREAFRSDSVSSAVPPQAQSTPDEDVEAANSAAQAPEATPASVNDEEVLSAEVDAQAEDAPENEPASIEDVNLPATDSALAASGEASQQRGLEPAAETEQWESWTAKPVKTKKTQGEEKKKKTKKKRQGQEWTEPAVDLTPPSTPPSKGPMEAEDVPQDNVLPGTAEPEPAGDPEASEEPSAQSKAGLEHAYAEWKQPSAFPTEDDMQREKPWAADEAEDLNATDKRLECPIPIIDMSFAKQSDSSPRTPGLSLWDEFTALRYHDDQQVSMSTVNSFTRTDLPYLTFHAKVYVFATRYLIPALAQLCLRKLHRELLHLPFADADPMDTQHLGGLAARQVPIVLDLLRYSYTKTTRLEPISPTSATQLRENELRRLVVHYAACKVKELARYHSPGDSGTATPTIRPVDAKVERADDAAPTSLRALLDMTPELASDLVYRMM